MQTTQAQIKLTLPKKLKEHITKKADRLGIPTAAYIRHLVLLDATYDMIPHYEASLSTENDYSEAISNNFPGHAVSGNIKDFLDTHT